MGAVVGTFAAVAGTLAAYKFFDIKVGAKFPTWIHRRHVRLRRRVALRLRAGAASARRSASTASVASAW